MIKLLCKSLLWLELFIYLNDLKMFKKLTIIGMLAGMPFFISNSFGQASVEPEKGSEEVPHTCPESEIVTHPCVWNDAASCDVAGQIVC